MSMISFSEERRTVSFEADVPADADVETVQNIRKKLLDFIVSKTGAERNDLSYYIEFDKENGKFVFVCSETIIG